MTQAVEGNMRRPQPITVFAASAWAPVRSLAAEGEFESNVMVTSGLLNCTAATCIGSPQSTGFSPLLSTTYTLWPAVCRGWARP